MAKTGNASSSSSPLVASNRRAYHEYHVLETLEAGIVLQGTEIKSIRNGKVSLSDAHARIEKGEVYLYGMNISPYEKGSYNNHNPLRVRKLLLHRQEIARLTGKTQEKGLTLIPLKLYFHKCWVKIELGLCKGKKLYDKRESTQKRETARELQRAIKRNAH